MIKSKGSSSLVKSIFAWTTYPLTGFPSYSQNHFLFSQFVVPIFLPFSLYFYEKEWVGQMLGCSGLARGDSKVKYIFLVYFWAWSTFFVRLDWQTKHALTLEIITDWFEKAFCAFKWLHWKFCWKKWQGRNDRSETKVPRYTYPKYLFSNHDFVLLYYLYSQMLK